MPNSMRMLTMRTLVLSVVFALATAHPVFAAPEAAAPQDASTELATEEDDWHFTIAPYLWIPEVHGKVAARGVTAPVDIDFDEIFDAIGAGDLLALMGRFEVRHRRLTLFVDSFHLWADSSVSRNPVADVRVKATVDTRVTMVQFGPAYRVFEMPSPAGDPLWIDALVGGRVWYADTDVATKITTRFETRNQSGNVNGGWIEPLVGLRWSVPLGVRGLNLNAWGDVGGFGAGSQFTWNAQGVVNYRLPQKLGHADVTLGIGYRAIDFERETSAGGSKKRLDLNLRGPLLGVAFTF